MTRTATASWALSASAFVLAGLLLLSLKGRFADPTPFAHAGMVLNPNNYTFLTANVGRGDERLFIIDDQNHRILVYDLNVTRRRLEPMAAQDLDALFGAIAGESDEPEPERVPR